MKGLKPQIRLYHNPHTFGDCISDPRAERGRFSPNLVEPIHEIYWCSRSVSLPARSSLSSAGCHCLNGACDALICCSWLLMLKPIVACLALTAECLNQCDFDRGLLISRECLEAKRIWNCVPARILGKRESLMGRQRSHPEPWCIAEFIAQTANQQHAQKVMSRVERRMCPALQYEVLHDRRVWRFRHR